MENNNLRVEFPDAAGLDFRRDQHHALANIPAADLLQRQCPRLPCPDLLCWHSLTMNALDNLRSECAVIVGPKKKGVTRPNHPLNHRARYNGTNSLQM